ncbi:YopX family protein [Tenacibaculum maritimum]|uniref:YopX family protein n=1 Tax=Tenacibaculum maritimum TaxID=107401 RepID=UPI003890127E
MNREIKFRAWDKARNKMINDNDIFDNGFNRGRKYPSYITQKGVHYIKPYGPIIKSECSFGGYYSDWDKELIYKDVQIMQSAGLKSKGGKEVYEGDIFRHEEETEHGDIRTYSVVMWIKQRGAYYLIPCDHYKSFEIMMYQKKKSLNGFLKMLYFTISVLMLVWI